MSALPKTAILLAHIVGLLVLGISQAPAQTAGDPCHGARGDGAGEVARWSQPRPRDFRQGIYKFSSTPYGFLPTAADLDRVIQDGLYGTRMPPFIALSVRERRDVIGDLQTLSPRWRNEGPGTSLAVTNEPAPTRESVTQGRELFGANCSKCHGDGSGNGPSAAKLMDDWGAPIVPGNLMLGRGKWARTTRDIYVRAMSGINGTPMPESGDALTPDQVWQIVHYVQALGAWKGSSPEMRALAAELPPPEPRTSEGNRQ